MLDLEAALEEIRRFGARPPGPTPSIEQVQARARAERRRRRRRGGVAVGLIVLIGLAGAAVARSDEEPDGLRAVDEGPTATTIAPVHRLLVEPSTDLEDGQVVMVTLPRPPRGDAIVAQCAAEAGEVADPAPWCDLNIQHERAPAGAGHFRVTVVRTIETSNGIIDCASRPERCVIGVRSGGDLLSPISFRDDLGPVVDAAIAVDRAAVADGDSVVLTGTGFHPNAEIFVSQCQAMGADEPLCDTAHGVHLVADAEGAFTRPFLVHHEIFLDYEGWRACDPCVIHAWAMRQARPTVAIDVVAGPRSTRPTVEIVPAGPYTPGQLVELRGSGFQAAVDNITIGWCRFNTSDPASEAQGAGPEYADCVYPEEGFVRSDDAGGFVVEAFPMPEGAFGPGGATCDDPAARCGLAWHPGEGSFPVFITFFEMASGSP